MSKIYEVMVRFKIDVAIHDEELSIADYLDDMGYDFQTGIDVDADIQNFEMLDYDIVEEHDTEIDQFNLENLNVRD